MLKQISDQYDVVIIGAGPAGTSLAISMAQYNRKILIIEKVKFPRFHIGESLTGQSAETLRGFGLGDYMEQGDYPVKHGVQVHGPTENSKFWVPVQKLGADGKAVKTHTWQVRRADFDLKLLETAIERGAEYIHASADDILGPVDRPSGVLVTLEDGMQKEVKARLLVDASGQSRFLGRQGVLGPVSDAGYEKQIAIFAHVKNVEVDPAPNHGNTHIFYGKTLHWSWLIPQDETKASLGVVMPIDAYKASNLSKDAFFIQAVKNLNDELSRRAKNVEIVSPVRAISNYSYRYQELAGPGFLAVGDSHGFLDPIFAFGVNNALEEGRIAAAEIERFLNRGGQYDFSIHTQKVRDARAIMQLVIDTFWQYPLAFLKLMHYSHQTEFAELFSGRFFDERTEGLEVVSLMRDLLSQKAA